MDESVGCGSVVVGSIDFRVRGSAGGDQKCDTDLDPASQEINNSNNNNNRSKRNPIFSNFKGQLKGKIHLSVRTLLLLLEMSAAY
jgi:hypothetical protein